MIKKTPERKETKQVKNQSHNEWIRKAAINFKRARICEQMTYRIEILHHKTGDTLKFRKSQMLKPIMESRRHMTASVRSKQGMARS